MIKCSENVLVWVFYVLGENPAVLQPFFPPFHKRCNYSLVSRNLESTLKEVPDWRCHNYQKNLISWTWGTPLFYCPKLRAAVIKDTWSWISLIIKGNHPHSCFPLWSAGTCVSTFSKYISKIISLRVFCEGMTVGLP